ncbi:hypothetical protein [Streptomyces sp. NPDC005989]|uniref:hypothetical protein n=1 Tax=Streptomyces sp. NPDC005989 TaxID=3156727 RepID=UPI0033C7B9B4
MSETTPNAKGPARIQRPADATPTDLATLTLEYRSGRPVIVVSGGTVIPAGLPVVNETGNPVATYNGAELTTGAKSMGGYQVWNSNITNLLDVATNAWSTDEDQAFLDRFAGE